ERLADGGLLARTEASASRGPRELGALLEPLGVADVRTCPRGGRTRELDFAVVADVGRDERKRDRRAQADALHGRAVGEREEQRRHAEQAGVRVVVEVLLRAALSVRRSADARPAAIGGERAGEHLGGA